MNKPKKTKLALQLKSVSQYFLDKCILRQINLKVEAGELITIVGPSGCGKSTLLNLILGSLNPSKGEVKEFGNIKQSPTKNCGIVYQKYALYPHLTVKENTMFGLFNAKKCRQERKKEFEQTALDYLDRVNLVESRDKYPFELSGGMQQRVAIAQALITNPEIILLDEPFSALDFWTEGKLQQLILELYMREKKTIIFITHNVEEAVYLGSRIIVLGKEHEKDGATIVLDEKIDQPYPRRPSFKTSRKLNRILEKVYDIDFNK